MIDNTGNNPTRGRPPKVSVDSLGHGITPSNSSEAKGADLPAEKHFKDDGYNINIVRDFDGKIDIFYLNKTDPKFKYRWLRDDPKNLTLKRGNILQQKGGWQLCPREHLLKLEISEKEISGDGLYRRGDTVLARIPIELYNEKEEYRNKQANEQLSAIERLLKEGDPNEGGKDIHETMKGIQTKEALKGNFKE